MLRSVGFSFLRHQQSISQISFFPSLFIADNFFRKQHRFQQKQEPEKGHSRKKIFLKLKATSSSQDFSSIQHFAVIVKILYGKIFGLKFLQYVTNFFLISVGVLENKDFNVQV